MHAISNKRKIIVFFLSVTAIVYALASGPELQVYETSLIKSIREKFNSFYNHAQQDRIYVQTDKSFYKPGETIWFTAYVRDAQTFKASDNSDIIHIELITPKGTTEKHYKIIAKDGSARGDFDLNGHPGGIYKIKAYTDWQKNDDSIIQFEKEITVQSVVMPRLKMKLDFEKKAYGKSDEVVAKLELNTNADKPLGNTEVKFKAQLAGTDLKNGTATTDGQGKVNLRFRLPADLNTIDGIVNIMIDFEGSTESVSRSIPIVLNKIKLEFFPEGGDLVANLNSRVAFKATNEFGKPADIEGTIVDSKGTAVTNFSSFHFGMGALDLQPAANEHYKARITKPAGITDEFDLPETFDAGYVLSVESQNKDAINLTVQSFQSEELSIIAQTRGKIYYSGSFKALKGNNPVSINTRDFPIGISQITLFDAGGIERCERLVFVHKNQQLKITVSTDKPQYQPREQVNVTIKVADDKGVPMPGNFSLAVVDDNLLSFADDRQGNILSKMLLEPELKEKVEEPDFYFDAKEHDADKALDLLMMTSGWRHYVWKQILDGNYPASKFKGEKAVIAGTVYCQKTRQPLPGARVKIADQNLETITDKDGNFSIRGADISSRPALELTAPYCTSQRREIYNYGSSNNFYMDSTWAIYQPDKVYAGMPAPAPGTMNYQAVVRDANGQPLAANKQVSIRFSIHANSANGRVIYTEIDSAVTNQFGLISTYIGQKKKLDDNNWQYGTRYLEVEVDNSGANNFENMGTTQLAAVPYALYAQEVASGNATNLDEVTVTSSKHENNNSQQNGLFDAIRGNKNVKRENLAALQYNQPGQNQVQATTEALELARGTGAGKAPARPDLIDVASKPDIANAKDYEPDPRGGPIMEAPLVAAKYKDARAEGYMAFDKNMEAQGQRVIFYRAKEFPVKKYTEDDLTRSDFAGTVYWNGHVITDHTGLAKISFTTNDLISSFKTTIEGFGDDGSIGRAEYNYSTSIPFAMDAKVPVELVSGDNMMIPVFLKNTTSENIIGKLEVAASNQLQLQSNRLSIELAANSSKVFYIQAAAGTEAGDGTLEIKFKSEKYNDDLLRHVTVVAKGFPASISMSGEDLDKAFSFRPENVVPGSMKVNFTAYPNIMSQLMSGVASILREPNGCFEQTSSSNYPNIMALEYLKSMNVKDPELEAKATTLLDKGYKKLTGFETKENGYEWFGAAPAHEALTAYGLMEFQDMKKVYNGVDQQMVSRTANLLLSRKDGQGGFKKNPKALDSFGKADDDVTNAYIVYALSEAGYKDAIKNEMDEVYKSAKKSNDPYVMALCANALFNTGDNTRGEEMLTRLLASRGEAGFWTGKKHSITRSTGEGLKVETSSLVLLALLKSQKPDNGAITGAVKFLVGARSGYGGFGSTQATILALKALTYYAEYSRRTDESGTVQIYVNGVLAGTKDYAKGEQKDITVEGLEKYVGDGQQNIEVRFNGCKQALPYAMNVTYSTTQPESAKECAVNITTKLSATSAKVGETVRLTTTVKNKTAEGQPMTMAIVGLPGGFSAQPWQLKEMQEKGVIDFYEITGNNIAFYYRSLAPNAEKQINLDLKAEIPGDYDAPASSAYLYYTNELKTWVGLQKVSVRAL